MGTTSRASLDKKEHLNFGASSSSVTSFEVSAITQKYLKPQPTKAAMQLTDLEPMIEEDSSESGDSIVKSTRAAKALASERKRAAVPSNPRNQDNKIRGAHPSSRAMLPPFRQPRDTFKADETYFRTSSEIRADPLRNDGKADESYFRTSSEIRADPLQNDGKSDDRKPSQNSGGKSSRTSSISDDEELRKDQASLSSSKCFSEDECFSGDEEETLANLITASKRQDRESVRAHKADIAGIGAGSAKTKPPTTTATYQLTKRDQDMLHHISELEARVLQYQKELPRLLDKYRASTEKAKTAQQELRESKARVHRYQKAYSTVARAIRTGRLYIQQKEYMAAILELARAAGIEKSNATLWYMLAECRLKISQPAAAEEACLTSLKLQPSGAGVALLGRILQERGRHDEAIQCYLSALGRNEENADDE
ncbi:hypothetical protein PHYBOEH_003326 [Phytophthora boehmeriae]|uniref:Uncharacterized protein n=1 Tax=Phytophthora boehmeriae TaxID=109152 RepID=A0A8T1WR68_9STRA|nr:hypothetical protein PHYBOEH_003326 [Phytophthora boehmeriae]